MRFTSPAYIEWYLQFAGVGHEMQHNYILVFWNESAYVHTDRNTHTRRPKLHFLLAAVHANKESECLSTSRLLEGRACGLFHVWSNEFILFGAESRHSHWTIILMSWDELYSESVAGSGGPWLYCRFCTKGNGYGGHIFTTTSSPPHIWYLNLCQ